MRWTATIYVTFGGSARAVKHAITQEFELTYTPEQFATFRRLAIEDLYRHAVMLAEGGPFCVSQVTEETHENS